MESKLNYMEIPFKVFKKFCEDVICQTIMEKNILQISFSLPIHKDKTGRFWREKNRSE